MLEFKGAFLILIAQVVGSYEQVMDYLTINRRLSLWIKVKVLMRKSSNEKEERFRIRILNCECFTKVIFANF